jgi:hypothetical protein
MVLQGRADLFVELFDGTTRYGLPERRGLSGTETARPMQARRDR